jgi:hypothetical protein
MPVARQPTYDSASSHDVSAARGRQRANLMLAVGDPRTVFVSSRSAEEESTAHVSDTGAERNPEPRRRR